MDYQYFHSEFYRYFHYQLSFYNSCPKEDFIPTRLAFGTMNGLRSRLTQNNHEKDGNEVGYEENEKRNTVLAEWKYWDDLPEKYGTPNKRHKHIKNRRR